MSRYKHLTQVSDQKLGLKETVAASIKTLENQDLLQRQRRYKTEENAELPKGHNKVLHQKGVTAPSLTKTQIKKLQEERNQWLDQMERKKIKKPKVIVPKKSVAQKQIAVVTQCGYKRPLIADSKIIPSTFVTPYGLKRPPYVDPKVNLLKQLRFV